MSGAKEPKIAADSVLLISVGLKAAGRAAPIFIYLHENLKVNAFTKKLFESLACFGRNFLECNSTVPDDNALLTFTLNVDYGIDVDVAFMLLKLLHHNFDGVGYFLVIIEQDFLANDFRNKETGGLIRPLVLVEIGRRVGQQILDAAQHIVDVELCHRGDGEDFRFRQNLVPIAPQVSPNHPDSSSLSC